MSYQNQKKIKFIQDVLPQLILNYNEDLKDHSVLECIAEQHNQLEGLQSSLFLVDLKLKNSNDDVKLHQLIVKMQKDGNDEEDDFLFINEMYVYNEVIPYFKKFLKASSVTKMGPDNWTPRIYYVDFDVPIDTEHKTSNEPILVMDNLKAQSYRDGPKLDLGEAHLKLMIQQIAEFHSISYAMRINKNPMLKTLIEGLIPFTFITPEGKYRESYKIMYTNAMERCFNSIENDKKLSAKTTFLEKIEKLKEAVSENPLILMQKFLTTDSIWSIILHGDYNRNNVLFKYDSPEGHDNPIHVKMIDFQEVRYATPVIDLAFFMYMNMHSSLRSSIWNSLLKLYHETLINCIMDILKCEANDPRLAPYKFELFTNHFSKYAFYGAMVSIMFILWMVPSSEECQKLFDLFETDQHDPEIGRLTRICGGENVDKRMTSIIAHAYEEGYMEIFE